MISKMMKEKIFSSAENQSKKDIDVTFNENDKSTWGNPGRNDKCPCGSGKKFKHCHGKL